MSRFRAFLFDLNGTMINDMAYHVNAWYTILNNLGANISMERVKAECYGKNHELIERVFPGRFTQEQKEKMSLEKERKYQEDFRPHLSLITGLGDFLKKAYDKEIKLGIGSAAIMYNINFVIDGLSIRKYFSSLISADDVAHSKPDAETFLKCAEELNVTPEDCVVFEDAPKGVESAINAGMKTIVILTLHKEVEFSLYPNVLFFINDFKDARLNGLMSKV